MNRYFTQDHEWIDVEGDSGTVGISDYAQGQLGDIVYVDLPAPGAAFAKGKAALAVESVKAASDVYCPVSGTVTMVNDALADAPELVNSHAESDGWLIKITLADAHELDGLMDRAAYDAYVKTL